MTSGPDRAPDSSKDELLSFDEEFPLPSIPGVDDWAHRVAPRVKSQGATFEREPLPTVSEVLSQERTPPTRQKNPPEQDDPPQAQAGRSHPTSPSGRAIKAEENAGGAPRGGRRSPNRARLVSLVTVGLVVCGLAWWQTPRLIEQTVGPLQSISARSVVGSEPQATAFRGQENLGSTPLVVEWDTPGEKIRLEKEGYLSQELTLGEESENGLRVERLLSRLAFAPRPLEWEGLPPGSQIWWEGRELKAEQLTAALPGTYRLKVKPPGEPSLALLVEVPEPSLVPFAPLAISALVTEALAQRPRLTIAWKGESVKPSSQTVIQIVEVGAEDPSSAYRTEVALTAEGEPVTVVVPRAGSYRVSYAGSSDYKPYRATLEAKSSGTLEHQVALEARPKAPPPVASPSFPSWSSGGGGGSYRPVYRPPSGGGGGGGGGRIAPPSF